MSAPERGPECHESYQACMAARKERVERVIAENPGATKKELAALAGVHPLTIQRARNPRGRTPVSPPRTPVCPAALDLADATDRITEAWDDDAAYDGPPKLLVWDALAREWHADETTALGITWRIRRDNPRIDAAIAALAEMPSTERAFFDAWLRGWVQTCSGRLTARDPQ